MPNLLKKVDLPIPCLPVKITIQSYLTPLSLNALATAAANDFFMISDVYMDCSAPKQSCSSVGILGTPSHLKDSISSFTSFLLLLSLTTLTAVSILSLPVIWYSFSSLKANWASSESFHSLDPSLLSHGSGRVTISLPAKSSSHILPP